MDTLNFTRGLILNFGVMVTLVSLVSVVTRPWDRLDTGRRATALLAAAVVSGWITILLGVRVGHLVFDLRFLPGVIVAIYARRAWVIAAVFTAVGLARFAYGLDRPALNGFLIMAVIGVVLAALSSRMRRVGWNDHVKVTVHVLAALTINLGLMLLLQRPYFPSYFGHLLPVQYGATMFLCWIAALIFRDLDADRGLRAELIAELFTDPLTGLPNRRHMIAHLERLRRRTGLPFAAAYIDIDHFKAINDRYGHMVGDVVIAEVGAQIAGNVRARDYVARMGGEEFVVVLPDCRGSVALEVAERVRTAIEDVDLRAVDPRLRVTVSIGLASAESLTDDLVDRADIALFRAKAAGRNTVMVSA